MWFTLSTVFCFRPCTVVAGMALVGGQDTEEHVAMQIQGRGAAQQRGTATGAAWGRGSPDPGAAGGEDDNEDEDEEDDEEG